MGQDDRRGEAAFVNTGYREQRAAASTAAEARLHKKSRCAKCVTQGRQHVRANSGQPDERRLCRRCWKLTLQKHDAEELGAKTEKKDAVQGDTGQSRNALALCSISLISCQSAGATKARIKARKHNKPTSHQNIPSIIRQARTCHQPMQPVATLAFSRTQTQNGSAGARSVINWQYLCFLQ